MAVGVVSWAWITIGLGWVSGWGWVLRQASGISGREAWWVPNRGPVVVGNLTISSRLFLFLLPVFNQSLIIRFETCLALFFGNYHIDLILLFLWRFLLLKCFPLVLGFFPQSSQFFLVHFLQSLQLLYFLHSFIQQLSFFNDFVPFVLQFLVLLDHRSPFMFKLLVFFLQIFSLLLFLVESSLNKLSLSLEFLFFLNQSEVMLPFLFDLSFLLLKFFLFPDQFFPLPVKLLTLSFSIADWFIIESHALHFLFDHVIYSGRLARVVLLQPSAYHIKQFLHCSFLSSLKL